MGSSKGQTMAFVAVLFGIVVMSVLAMMMMSVFNDGALFGKDITGQINQEVSAVNKHSVMTSTLHDEVMRAEEDGGRALSYDYEDMKAYRLISYYYTSNDVIYVGDREMERQLVKQDLEAYFDYKMGQHYETGSTDADYYLSVGRDDIVVKEDETYPEKSWERAVHQIPLADGERVQFGIWTRTEGSIYGDSS